ncbi:hypothetical protein [Pricia antarctica]|nr:hypothetical protein [Pricia antarctica]
MHNMYFENIDPIQHILQTKEEDSPAKVWKHKISIAKIDNGLNEY